MHTMVTATRNSLPIPYNTKIMLRYYLILRVFFRARACSTELYFTINKVRERMHLINKLLYVCRRLRGEESLKIFKLCRVEFLVADFKPVYGLGSITSKPFPALLCMYLCI